MRPPHSPGRARRRPLLRFKIERTSCWLLAVSLVLWVLVAVQFSYQTRTGFPLDFAVYRDAATNMLHGGVTYRAHFTLIHLNFTYPPFALLLFSVLTVTSRLVVLAIWWLLSSAALVIFVILALNSLTELPRRIVVPASLALCGASCLFLEPVRSNMDFGQINFFLMLAILVDVLGVWRSSRGLLTGLAVAIKLTPLIYITYFAVIRSRAAVLRVLGTFVAAAVVAWLVLPSDSVLFWFHQAFSPGRKGGAKGTANQSWFGLVGHYSSTLGSSTTIVWLALSAVTFLLGLYLAKRYVTTARPIEALLALALTELLVSPVSWTHHWSWIILLPVILIAKWRHDRWVSGAMLLLLLVAVAAPYRWHRYSWYDHGLLPFVGGFSLLLAGVVLMITMAVTEWQRCRREARIAALDHALISGDATPPVETAGLSEPSPS
jgi:alpha-1,2-mannosyltransferase